MSTILGTDRHQRRDQNGVGIKVEPALPRVDTSAVGHDQFDLLILDRVAAHFATIRVDAAVAVDTIECRRADPHHDQRLLACRLEPISGDTPFAPEPEMAFVERGAGIPLLLMHGSVSDYRVWARKWSHSLKSDFGKASELARM